MESRGGQVDTRYAELVRAVDTAHAFLERLEHEPPTPKRDAAIEILRASLGEALLCLVDYAARAES